MANSRQGTDRRGFCSLCLRRSASALPADSANLVLCLPTVPAPWQFLIDIIPAQLAAEQLARLRGADCDDTDVRVGNLQLLVRDENYSLLVRARGCEFPRQRQRAAGIRRRVAWVDDCQRAQENVCVERECSFFL